MIYTGNYDNCKTINAVSISGDKGKSIGFDGEHYSALAPKLSFWKQWHDNIGIISEKENNDFYIREYYKEVLSTLDPQEVFEDLQDNILLCYETPELFCHRHIVAAWLETELDIVVPEVKVIDSNIIEIEKNNQIKEDYKRLILDKQITR